MESHDRDDTLVTAEVVRAVAPLHVPNLHRMVAASRRHQGARPAGEKKKREKVGTAKGGASSFVACHSHLIGHHASVSRQAGGGGGGGGAGHIPIETHAVP